MTENVYKHIKYKELLIYMFKMETIDTLVTKVNNIKQKFCVFVIDDNENDNLPNDNLDEDDKDENVKMLKEDILCRVEYRIPKWNEFESSEIIFMGNVMLFSLLVFRNIMPILKLLYVMFMMANGFGSAFFVIAYSYNFIKQLEKSKLEEYEIEDLEYMKSIEVQYNEFLNIYYEEFCELYQNDISYEAMCLYDEDKLKQLKEKENHYILSLPIEKNNKIIMFYDHELSTFKYYTRSSDVIYKVLNACCRSYVYDNKCMNLFQDEEEINYIKSLALDDESYEELNENDEQPEDEKPEEEDEKQKDTKQSESDKKGGIFSLFYEKKEAKEKIMKHNEKINKFIHKGNMDDYNKEFKSKKEIKKVDYNDFKTLFDKNN